MATMMNVLYIKKQGTNKIDCPHCCKKSILSYINAFIYKCFILFFGGIKTYAKNSQRINYKLNLKLAEWKTDNQRRHTGA